ncbi:MAG TPA: PTS transporter subunit EIIB, partial [Soehngenia sp.]|nr:PTS transporter subunit EIIB [Soehngenia sp.]
MDNKELAKRIVELVGGKENVLKAANCMTRLRITVKD